MKRLAEIAKQYEEWRNPENICHVGHYLGNVLYILAGITPDERKESAKSARAITARRETLFEDALKLNPETGKFE